MTLLLALPLLAATGPQTALPNLALPASPDSTRNVKGSGVIGGRVTSQDTGKPLRRAQVRLAAEGDDASTSQTASTSADGRYEFRGIPPGRYTLSVQRSGYLGLSYGQRRPGEQPRPLEIRDKEPTEKIDFALLRMGVISGRVLDELGEPAASVMVWALQARYMDGRRRLVPIAGSARTDVTGQYRLLSLPPGDYVVMGSSRETWPLDSDPRQIFGYAPSYFPGTSTPATAQRVKTVAGKETADIDFSLVPGRASTLRGTATSLAGLPLAGETVTLQPEMAGSTASTGSTQVAGDGTWTLSSVVPGDYRLSIRTRPSASQPGQEAQLTINVSGVDLEGLSLVAAAGGIVRGQVVTDDGSPLPSGFDRIRVRPVVNPGTRFMPALPNPENGRVWSDGSFEVQGVTNESLLSVGPLPGDWTLKAIEVDGREVTDVPLPLEPGATLSGVRIVLTSRFTTVRGVLRDENRNPAEGTVIVFADDSAKWRQGSRALRVTRSDHQGLFTFKGLPAGDYCLIALDSVQDGQWYDPEFLEGLKVRAERVAIAWSESKVMDLVIRK